MADGWREIEERRVDESVAGSGLGAPETKRITDITEQKRVHRESGGGDVSEADGRDDEQLMVAFCRGSREAFTELFARYRQPLYGFFRRRVVDPARAEELTQDVFVAVLKGAERWEPAALFRTYLYAIGLKILRAERRKMAFRAAFVGVEKSEAAARSSLDVDVVMRDALRRLDGMDREVLMLREFEQLSYAEIGELLGLPVNTVRSRLFRARAALRDVLTAPVVRVEQGLRESEERA